MACKKKVIAEQTAQLFFQNIWVHFGFPTSIVGDRDSHLVGNFWSSLWGFMDTKLKKSTTFHPQTEVMNITVIHLLRVYCSKHAKLWDEHFHYIQHTYNRAKKYSTQTSPFESCLRCFPKHPSHFMFGKYVAIDGHIDIDKARRFIEQI